MTSHSTMKLITSKVLLRPHQRLLLRSNSSAFQILPESMKRSIRDSVLDEAVRDDSRLWKYGTNGEASVNQATTNLFDRLDDLYSTQKSRYFPNLPPGVNEFADPVALARDEISTLSESIREDLLGTDHPVLNKAASYFFDPTADGGKKVRPLMVFLLSRALSESVSATEGEEAPDSMNAQNLFAKPLSWQRKDLPQAQRRLAEISEIIHTASLFHDDVIDGADTRRGVPSVHMVFGNKMAILAGDYLLARASICLARLRNVEVVETMSTIIEHLVRGEVMQMRGTTASERSRERIVYYLRKNFYKTGSLMANSCKSAAILGSYSSEFVDASYLYGKHVGMAFQLVDDILDFEGSLAGMGKPSLSDLKAGLATLPVLFAAEEYPELEELIDRKFKNDGDIEFVVDRVFKSKGLERSKELARVHAESGMDAIMSLDGSIYRDSLIQLARQVVSRTK